MCDETSLRVSGAKLTISISSSIEGLPRTEAFVEVANVPQRAGDIDADQGGMVDISCIVGTADGTGVDDLAGDAAETARS